MRIRFYIDEEGIADVLEGPGEDRAVRVLAHYEGQTEEQALAEDDGMPPGKPS